MAMSEGSALDFVFRFFDLEAKSIANASGVNPETISRYRNNNRDLKASNLIKILKALPSDARHMFLSLVSEEIKMPENLEDIDLDPTYSIPLRSQLLSEVGSTYKPKNTSSIDSASL